MIAGVFFYSIHLLWTLKNIFSIIWSPSMPSPSSSMALTSLKPRKINGGFLNLPYFSSLLSVEALEHFLVWKYGIIRLCTRNSSMEYPWLFYFNLEYFCIYRKVPVYEKRRNNQDLHNQFPCLSMLLFGIYGGTWNLLGMSCMWDYGG